MKMIYFPGAHERRKVPFVIHVTAEFEDEYKGAPEGEQPGRFDWYKKARCKPYSDALMERICELVTMRDEIIAALEQLRTRKVQQEAS